MKRLTKKRKAELKTWIKQQALKAKDLKHKQNFATLYEIIKAYEEQETTFKEFSNHYQQWFNMNEIQFRAIKNRKIGKLIKLRKGEYNAH